MRHMILLFSSKSMIAMHVFLYLKELNEKGEGRVILEGEDTALPRTTEGKVKPYDIAKSKGWIEGVCKARSMATKSLEFNEKEGLRILSDLEGHPSIVRYLNEGYNVFLRWLYGGW